MVRPIAKRVVMIVAALSVGLIASGCKTTSGAKPVVTRLKPVAMAPKVHKPKPTKPDKPTKPPKSDGRPY